MKDIFLLSIPEFINPRIGCKDVQMFALGHKLIAVTTAQLFACSRLAGSCSSDALALSSKGLDAILAAVVIVLEIPGLLSHPVLLVQQLVIKSWLHCTCTPHSQPAVTAQR